jgi:hypothetical protein
VGLDLPDDEIHAIRQAETEAPRLNQVTGIDEAFEQPLDRCALFARDLELLQEFAGRGRVVDTVADGGQQLFAVQH